jgi:hypothetical protein
MHFMLAESLISHSFYSCVLCSIFTKVVFMPNALLICEYVLHVGLMELYSTSLAHNRKDNNFYKSQQ